LTKKYVILLVAILASAALVAIGAVVVLLFERGDGGEIAPVLAVVEENGGDENRVGESHSPTQIYEPEQTPAPTARLAFVGDIMCHDTQLDAARISPGTYDFNYKFRYIAPYLQAADFTIGNLETTLVRSGYAGWPLFRSPASLAEALLNAGFDMVTTGNNHSFDALVPGVHSTIEILDEVGLARTGTFLTPECREEITVFEVNGFTFAIVNMTMHVNALESHMYNHMYMVQIIYLDLVEQATIDYEMIRETMARARALETDFIIASPHIGIEYYGTMNRQGAGHRNDSFDRTDGRWVNWIRTLELFLDEGADMVMNHHPHTLLPAEFVYVTNEDGTTRRAFMAYSLANFVSGQRTQPRETTAIFYLDVARDEYGNAYISAASHVPVWVRQTDPTRAPLQCFTVLPVVSTLRRADREETPDLRPQDIERMREVHNDVTHMLSGEPVALYDMAYEYPITRSRTREEFPGLPLWGTLPWR